MLTKASAYTGLVLEVRCAGEQGGKSIRLGLEKCFQVLTLLAPVTLTGVTLMGRGGRVLSERKIAWNT